MQLRYSDDRKIESFALTAGAFASLLPTRRSEGLPGTHPLCTSHIRATSHILADPCSSYLHALQLLSGSEWPLAKNPACKRHPIQFIGSLSRINVCTAPAGSMSVGRTWTLLSGWPINFHKVSTVHSIPMFSTRPCLRETASILVAKGQLLFSVSLA